jgi:tetratricopeptide (TPR) repeat protein
MNRAKRSSWALGALAAATLLAAPAFGQVAAGGGGHALDANNQVGSGGANGTVRTPGPTQNDIIYGNVSGGIEFHGPHERDPAAFFGPVDNVMANFVRNSGGVPTAYQAQTFQGTPQAYYDANRYVPPPIGTERLGSTGGYIGTALTPDINSQSLDARITASSDLLKQRLGETAILGANSNLLKNNSPVRTVDQDQPGNALLADLQANTYVGSPLYGLQSDNNALPINGLNGENEALPLFTPPSLMPGGTASLRSTAPEIQRMRAELRNNPNEQQNPALAPLPGQINSAITPPDLTQPIDTQNPSKAQNLTGSSLNASLSNSANLAGPQQRSTLMPARQQSATLRALEDRLRQTQSPLLTALQDQARQHNQIIASQHRAAVKNAKGPTSRPSLPDLNPPTPNGAGAGSGNGAMPRSEAPLQVPSLATGVEAKGLHDLLSSAEDLMRQDKFQSAIDKYTTAAEVAPNNALVYLGRANAELGAGYYRQASLDLHEVFRAEPALLLGQYQLDKWMSQKRLDFITKELTDLAATDKKSEMPVFLLGYMAYNTGHEADAAKNIEEAKKRSGGEDTLLDALQDQWKPGAGKEKVDDSTKKARGDELNK